MNLLRITLLLGALFMSNVGGAQDHEAELPALGLAVGEAHPDVLLPDTDGVLRRISDSRGKRLLVFHFASW